MRSDNFGIAIGNGATVTNLGLIEGRQIGIIVIAGRGNTVINAGTVRGGDFAIQMREADDTLVIQRGSVLDGAVDAGGGMNELVLQDGACFASGRNFQMLRVEGEALLVGDNTIDRSLITPGSTLTLGAGGTSGWLSSVLENRGTLVLNRSDDLTLAGDLTGDGALVKRGEGTAALAGAVTLGGSTSVEAGRLRIDGALTPNSVLDLGMGAGTVDLSTRSQSVARLSGTAGALELGGKHPAADPG